eukprot:SAG11_NODE_1531_length_4736_cov_2.690317_2_plen_106_part_00
MNTHQQHRICQLIGCLYPRSLASKKAQKAKKAKRDNLKTADTSTTPSKMVKLEQQSDEGRQALKKWYSDCESHIKDRPGGVILTQVRAPEIEGEETNHLTEALTQ